MGLGITFLRTKDHSLLTGLTTGDDHSHLQRESEKDQASGYAGLDSGTLLLVAHIPGLAASKITSGEFATARIPGLAASKITSGRFGMARMPAGTSGQVLTAQGAGVDPAYAAAAAGATLTIAETEVYNGTPSQAVWTDLDLSGTVGAQVTLVLLKFSNAYNTRWAVRKNGDTDEFYDAASEGVACGASAANEHVVLLVTTDASGIIEWISEGNNPTTIDIIAYIK